MKAIKKAAKRVSTAVKKQMSKKSATKAPKAPAKTSRKAEVKTPAKKPSTAPVKGAAETEATQTEGQVDPVVHAQEIATPVDHPTSLDGPTQI